MNADTFAPWRARNALRDATLSARIRTGDVHLGTRVDSGRVDIVRAVPTTRGRYRVTVLQCCPNVDSAVSALATLGA